MYLVTCRLVNQFGISFDENRSKNNPIHFALIRMNQNKVFNSNLDGSKPNQSELFRTRIEKLVQINSD